MTYAIGQIHPFDYTRKPVAGECAETWFILTSPPLRERAGEAFLERVGFSEVWTPTERAWRPSRGPRLRERYDRLIAPGYIFAMTEREPVWDVLFERARGRVSGVVSIGSEPYVVRKQDFEAMRKIPQRIRIEREKAIRAIQQGSHLEVGHPATLVAGPLAGYAVDITKIDKGIAHFLMGDMRGTSPVEGLER